MSAFRSIKELSKRYQKIIKEPSRVIKPLLNNGCAVEGGEINGFTGIGCLSAAIDTEGMGFITQI